MNRTFLFLSLTTLILTSCQKPAAPVVAVATPTTPEPKPDPPSVRVESHREHKLDDTTELRIWNLKINRLKRMTAKLLIAVDGKLTTANEIEYTWDQWDAPAATGQLIFMLQDGQIFGVKDKKLPSLTLEVQGSPNNTRKGMKRNLKLEGPLSPRLSNATHTESLSEKNVLYRQLFVTQANDGGSFSLSSDLDSIATASKDGKTIVAVSLEWTPQGK